MDAAIDLIAERGVRGFSLAEASRRLGVTVAAPYRHFADRDELLAAVAVRAIEAFGESLAAETRDTGQPAPRLAAMARGYVRFAAEQRPLFSVLYAAGLDKGRYPELQAAYERVDDMFDSCVAELCAGDPVMATALGDAVQATAHGYASLLLDGAYGDGPEAIGSAAEQAASAVTALIAGRSALRERRVAPSPQ